MTNIIATIIISVVTNVSTNFTHEMFSGGPTSCPEGRVGCLVYHYKHIKGDVIGKTETATVTEVKTLTFDWDGRPYSAEHKRVLSAKVKTWKKKEDWVQQ